MKKLILSLTTICAIILVNNGCTKPYEATDHTTGIVNNSKLWSGYSTGYAHGDTVLNPSLDTSHIAWAKSYYHVIHDSAFAVQKINGLQISVIGVYMNFISVDNSTHITLFDSTVAGSPTCFLKYNSVTGIMNMEYHSVGALNAASGHYYETNIYLQSN